MSKNSLAVIGIILIVLVVVFGVMFEAAGTPLFQGIGAVLLVVALWLFFTSKKGGEK